MVTLLLAAGSAPAAEPFRIGIPVECAFGAVCSVQNYVDLDPGPGRLDAGCGRLSYDGHDGTDIRVRDLVAMEEGVGVVAAADGVVKAIRDGMADVSVRETGLDLTVSPGRTRAGARSRSGPPPGWSSRRRRRR